MPESSRLVLQVLRDPSTLDWSVVPLLILVLSIYMGQVQRGRWDIVLLGLCTWAGELLWEMANALLLHVSGFAALWMTPGKSVFVLYAGLNLEIGAAFATAGVLIACSLPADREARILGLPNRTVIPVLWAALALAVEIALNRAGLLAWEWRWWGVHSLWPIFLVYLGGWKLVVWGHDALDTSVKARLAAGLAAAALVAHLVLATWLGWI